jgi:hypothetical protein
VRDTATRHSPIDGVSTGRLSIRTTPAGITALDVWAFALPALSFVQVVIVGRLILSEILAAALLPWLLRSRDRLRPPTWLIVLLGVWFASQILTDVVVGSAFSDWIRGWAAIAFTIIDLLAILTLAATPRRARIFAGGIAAGSALAYFFEPTLLMVADPWKFAFAASIGFTLAAGLSGAWAARRLWLVIAAFATFGVINAVLFGYRSMSGVALLTAAYLLLIGLLGRHRWLAASSPTRAIVGGGLFAASALLVFVGLNTAAAANLLGDAARAKFEAQSGEVGPSVAPGGSVAAGASIPPSASVAPGASAPANPLGVITGGRAEFLASTQAILDSPILGHGSWARGPKYVEMQHQKLIEMGVPRGNLPTDPTLIPTHSYLLGSWVWAGVAGGIVWLAVAAVVLWVIASLHATRLEFSPLIVFAGSLLLWSIAFSPYSNTERIYAMFAIVVCLLGLRMVQRQDEPVGQSVESAR